MSNKAKSKLLDRIEELSTNVTNSDPTLAFEFLKELGINPDEEKVFGSVEIQRLLFVAKARRNQQRDESLIQKLEEKIAASLSRNAALTIELLRNSLVSRQAQFQFRNIEKWDVNEMREVLNDLDLTKLLEDLDQVE